MIAPGSPTVRRRRLAAELRGIRESKGKSGDAVAAALKWSPCKISRYERARTGLRPREVERLLDYYQITGPRRELLLGLAEDAAQKGWWEEFADTLSEDYQQFIGLEHEATSMAIWHVDVVTGLFQTEAYARHIISSYSRVEPIPPGMIGRQVRRAAEPEGAGPPARRAAHGVRGILRRLRLRPRDERRRDAAGRREHRAPQERIHPRGGTRDLPAPDRVPDDLRRGPRSGGVPGPHPRDRRIAVVRSPASRPRLSRPDQDHSASPPPSGADATPAAGHETSPAGPLRRSGAFETFDARHT